MFRKNLFVVVLLLFAFISINAQTKFELEGNMLKLPKPIVFETGSDKINLEESKEPLNHVKEYLTRKLILRF